MEQAKGPVKDEKSWWERKYLDPTLAQLRRLGLTVVEIEKDQYVVSGNIQDPTNERLYVNMDLSLQWARYRRVQISPTRMVIERAPASVPWPPEISSPWDICDGPTSILTRLRPQSWTY